MPHDFAVGQIFHMCYVQCKHCSTFFASFEELQLHCASNGSSEMWRPTCAREPPLRLEMKVELEDACYDGLLDILDGEEEAEDDLDPTELAVHECKGCGKGFKKKRNLYIHRRKCRFPESLADDCQYCRLSFSTAPQLEAHIRGQHPEAVDFHVCSVCSEFFSRSFSLASHKKRKHQANAFECTLCKLSFGRLASLQDHVKTVHPDQGIVCQHCPVPTSFQSFSTLHMHIREVHLQARQSREFCQYCLFTTDDNEMFKNHLIRDHPEQLQHHTCGLCHRIFKNVSDVGTHIRDVHSETSECCHACGKRFGSARRLQVHQRNVHGSDRMSLSCDRCQYSCRSKQLLTQHQRNVHQPKSIICTFCGHRFASISHLKAHTDAVHFKVKNNVCDHCQAKFSRKESLKIHVKRVHLGEKAVKCPSCYRRYQDKEGLEKHLHKGCDQKKRKSRARGPAKIETSHQ